MSHDLHGFIQKATSLRSRGRYQEALQELTAPGNLSNDASLQCEVAMTFLLQHRYNELLQLLPENPLENIQSESKIESFNRMLRDFALVHEDLTLREASLSFEAVAKRWLMNRENQEYDRLDVYMISLYAIIESWSERFLQNPGSDMLETDAPSKAMLRVLRSCLLQCYRFEELVIVHISEAETCPTSDVISSLQDTLAHIRANSVEVGLVYEDLEAYIRLLLCEVYSSGNEQDERATSELQELQQIFGRTGNDNGIAWAQLYIISCQEPAIDDTGPFAEILDKFKSLDDWRGVQACSLAIAKVHRRKKEFKVYASTLLSLFQIRCEEKKYEPPISKSPSILQPGESSRMVEPPDNGVGSIISMGKKRQGEAIAGHGESSKRHKVHRAATGSNLNKPPLSIMTTQAPKPSEMRDTIFSVDTYDTNSITCLSTLPRYGSMFNFWRSYMDLLGEDLQGNQTIGSAIVICSEFFERHPVCSIPQLQYIFAITISQSYEEFGRIDMVLGWGAKAFAFAEATGDKELIAEANYHLQRNLASNAVVPEDDPTGMKLREFNRSRIADFEILYQEAVTQGKFRQQYGYAKELLDIQLSAEIRSSINPVGEPWLSKARQAVEELPGNERQISKSRIDLAIAHAKFEFGDYGTSILIINGIIDLCSTTDGELKSHALFTKGRAYLQIYLSSKDETDWINSHQALQASSEISSVLGKPDCVACCHTILAALWRTKIPQDPSAAHRALTHIDEAEKISDGTMGDIDILTGLNGVLTKYALRHRVVGDRLDVFETVFPICFESSDFAAAWAWAQRAKARAFCNSFRSIEVSIDETTICQTSLPDIKSERAIVYVHWVTAGDTIYMITHRLDESPQMFLLEIDLPTVTQWYADLIDTQDDLSDAESAEEILAELDPLVEPLGRNEVSAPGELIVLCPTKVLFKIPLHALSVGDQVLLVRNPVIYTHAVPLLRPQQQYDRDSPEQKIPQEDRVLLFGNPTGDIVGGEDSVNELGKCLGGKVLIKKEATKQAYMSLCANSRLVHYHGHVITYPQSLRNSMIFHGGEQLLAREVFSLDLHRLSPLICLIACGSGTQVLRSGDEPLGFIPAFLYAGASAVVATLWPIHDSLSGAAFTKTFYESFTDGSKLVDLALSLQRAALKIRSNDETRAPYFWAGFVLHGQWNFQL